MRPEGFAAELSDQWSRWVLDNGLPVLHLRRVFDDGEVCAAYEQPFTVRIFDGDDVEVAIFSEPAGDDPR